MSLVSLDNGWKRFANGRIWRCKSPDYLCEVDREGNTPNYFNLSSDVSLMRKIGAFYKGRLDLGTLNQYGYGLDVMIANSMTESFGTVPTPFSYMELKNLFFELRIYINRRPPE